MEHDLNNNNGMEEAYYDDDDDKHEKEQIIDAVYQSLRRLCGNSCSDEDELQMLAQSSVSFSNGHSKKHTTKKQTKKNCGKPHNIEIRIALSYFHRYRCRHSKQKKKQQPSSFYSLDNNHPLETFSTIDNINGSMNGEEKGALHIVSDLGLSRSIHSPFQLAKLILFEMEDILEGTGMDIQVAKPSGIICITTQKRSHYLRTVLNKLPCPHCTKWTNSIKGLWWHQQLEHNIHHSSAVDNALTENDKLHKQHSLIIYQPPQTTNTEQNCTYLPILSTPSKQTTSQTTNNDEQLMDIPTSPLTSSSSSDPTELVKRNNLFLLEKVLKKNDIDATTYMDKNGASLLHWAAGCGHVAIVKYLIEVCKVNVNQKQRGKRSFRNRTALHWAARNGHLTILQYLFHLPPSNYTPVLLDATTIDGTTAFCWASWQGHLHILK